ncbi:hypothetical protein GCM10023176_08420 [Micromonospora coerulea]|uniref:Uncharacterized protein n=1 Tax=Micromonospora coerulea TaxID=47856 RepID=A0ABP8S8D4_9ACTN
MKPGPAAAMTVRAAVLPHPQVLTNRLDLRAWVVTQPRRAASKSLRSVPPVLQSGATARHHDPSGAGVTHPQATGDDL